MIGLVTFVVGEIATVLGCVINLKEAVTSGVERSSMEEF
jgi:hypothetical protein